jgi:hypothetical protein
LLGSFFARERSARIFIYGLWGAYLLFGLYFDYHVATHDYYHLPLIPIVAVSIAPLADRGLSQLAGLATNRWMYGLACGILIYGLLAVVWDVRNQLKSVDYRPEAGMWAKIGDQLGHGSGVVALTQDYGSRLAYWGWQNAAIWPSSGDIDYHEARGATFDPKSDFAKLTRDKALFLVTDFDELDRQPELKEELAGFALHVQGDGYVIFDLQQPHTP